ncbi:MAG: 16S rRNA (adenine(1518)-N(6)/adenine(1519)-N(6))-dimethyltransferase RsmA [Longimicrobiales bacterium]|nr:16S rRNA (adenine(1518)-N(6)/adenine(1519)-N(6))-dimethyltransferase RsmA [Longimicrobiales bacterium]
MAERLPRAKRSLGQNFLVDGNLQRKIVAALNPGPGDLVVEIGPGPGALTDHLAGRVERLVLIELDTALATRLAERLGDRRGVEVWNEDILEVDLPGRIEGWEGASVIGNIPYNITTPILFHLLERPRPAEIVLMVQREVADRIVAKAGAEGYGALSVGVQSVANVELLFGVPRGAFRPVPRVDSAIVRVEPHHPPTLSTHDEFRLRRLTRAVFQWRRKQMQKTLRDHPDLALPREVVGRLARSTDLSRRPETFPPDELLALSRELP